MICCDEVSARLKCLKVLTSKLPRVRSFVAHLVASRPKQRPLCGLTYSTLKFMRLTSGKSTLWVPWHSVLGTVHTSHMSGMLSKYR